MNFLMMFVEMQILGLNICSETMVGDVMERGISGGQKKRLTTGCTLKYDPTVLTSHIFLVLSIRT